MPTFSASTFSRHTGRWLLITGIFELLLAGFFLFLSFTVPDAGKGGMLVTAGILGVTGFALLLFGVRSRGKAKEADRLQATGISGMATIMGATQTGMYLNEQPQIELDLSVAVPGRQPYQAAHTSFIPLMLLARVQPGTVLPVKVDPQDPSNFVIDWQGGAQSMPGMPGMVVVPAGGSWPPGAGMQQGTWPGQQGAWPAQQQGGWPVQAGMAGGQAVAQGGWPQAAPVDGSGTPLPTGNAWPLSAGLTATPQAPPAAAWPGEAAAPVAAAAPAMGSMEQQALDQLRQYLDANGQSGLARIETAQDTGVNIGTDRMVTMTLAVDAPGRSPYQVMHAAMVPPTHQGKVQPGMTLPVRFDPSNPQVLLVDWKDA